MNADLTPISKNEVAVQFTLFKVLGLLPVKAPEAAKGRLSVTFLDDELRISRGDRGAPPPSLLPHFRIPLLATLH